MTTKQRLDALYAEERELRFAKGPRWERVKRQIAMLTEADREAPTMQGRGR